LDSISCGTKGQLKALVETIVVAQELQHYNLFKSRSVLEVLEDVRGLPPSDLDWLMGDLFQSGDSSGESEIDAAWQREVKRRVAESEAGSAVTYSWEEVEAPLRARLAG
jgi:putative addiction module component (TIGR02574 family)